MEVHCHSDLMQGKPLGEKVAADQLSFPRRGAGVPPAAVSGSSGLFCRVAAWLAYVGLSMANIAKHNANLVMFAIRYHKSLSVIFSPKYFHEILCRLLLFVALYVEIHIRFDDD